MATKQQGCNNVRNLEYNNNSTLTTIYDNDNKNQQINRDSRIGKQNIDTFSINQDHPRNANPPNRNNNADLIIFHQYIRGLYNKIDELLYFWTIKFPHTLCFTEHHLCDHEITSTCIKYYNPGAKYCRNGCKYGGVSTFVHETLLFSTEWNEFCKDQDLGVCDVKLHISSLYYVFYVIIGLLPEMFLIFKFLRVYSQPIIYKFHKYNYLWRNKHKLS